MVWSQDNMTTFKPDKTAGVVVSYKGQPFDISGISMGGFDVEQVDELKVTGFLIDRKMLWGAHISMLVSKAKQRLGTLRNLTQYLNSSNMKSMYVTFIRSILEYGGVLFMGAAKTHLAKLDTVQRVAERLGKFEVESLESRRQAAAVALALKMLDHRCRPGLQKFAPQLVNGHHSSHSHHTQHKLQGAQIHPVRLSKVPLDIFKRSFFGQLPQIWSKLPQDLIEEGKLKSWSKISKRCKQHLKRACVAPHPSCSALLI